MVQNKALIYKTVPNGWPVAGEDLTIEDIGFDENAPPPKNGLTTKNLYAAYDPWQRGGMREPEAKVHSYTSAMKIGQPVVSITLIGRVLKSDNSNFKKGNLVIFFLSGIESYSILDESMHGRVRVLETGHGIPLTAYLGALGTTGMSAYGSLREIGRPRKGDVILISAAAGAVGQVVGQLAVREGLHVIGSVGRDEKLDFIINELGFTSGFNYKKENIADAVQRLAPDGIDIFYDNVGGELLDVAISSMKPFGRIIACGSISNYNNSQTEEPYRLANYSRISSRRIMWQGFLVSDPNIRQWLSERDEKISSWIKDGSFKSIDHVTEGMDNAIEGFLGMLKGENVGKSILKIADP